MGVPRPDVATGKSDELVIFRFVSAISNIGLLENFPV